MIRFAFDRVVEMQWLPGSVHAGKDRRRHTSHCTSSCSGDVEYNNPCWHANKTGNVEYFWGYNAKCDRCGSYTWYYANEVLFAQEVDSRPITLESALPFEPIDYPREHNYSISATINVTLHDSQLTQDGELKIGVKRDLEDVADGVFELLQRSGLFSDIHTIEWDF